MFAEAHDSIHRLLATALGTFECTEVNVLRLISVGQAVCLLRLMIVSIAC